MSSSSSSVVPPPPFLPGCFPEAACSPAAPPRAAAPSASLSLALPDSSCALALALARWAFSACSLRCLTIACSSPSIAFTRSAHSISLVTPLAAASIALAARDSALVMATSSASARCCRVSACDSRSAISFIRETKSSSVFASMVSSSDLTADLDRFTDDFACCVASSSTEPLLPSPAASPSNCSLARSLLSASNSFCSCFRMMVTSSLTELRRSTASCAASAAFAAIADALWNSALASIASEPSCCASASSAILTFSASSSSSLAFFSSSSSSTMRFLSADVSSSASMTSSAATWSAFPSGKDWTVPASAFLLSPPPDVGLAGCCSDWLPKGPFPLARKKSLLREQFE
mmetsp:Transcript_19394/g.46246  ORF Transcript_19394/g.46246 Transcript_19394/m.46246 type:complete len:349 (+) Transcript_19394:2173-3219(+)